MFRTVTANPLLSVGQGAYVTLCQESVEEDASKVVRRYAIINSDTLEVYGRYEGENARDQLMAATEVLLQAQVQAERTKTPLQEMMAAASPAPAAPAAPAPVQLEPVETPASA